MHSSPPTASADTDGQDALLASVAGYAASCAALEVLWLYGSRAVGTQGAHSDIDLAAALSDAITDSEQRHALLDDLSHALNQLLHLPVSVIDINRVATPLAYNVIAQGRVLLCRSALRLHAEEQRVWSLWAEYKREHERIHGAL
jgi:predicted nucleotidyltransferase